MSPNYLLRHILLLLHKHNVHVTSYRHIVLLVKATCTTLAVKLLQSHEAGQMFCIPVT